MAYSKWRNENMNTLQRQQMLHAAEAFKSFTIKHDVNERLNPAVAMKCLKVMRRMKSARIKNNSYTISEILSIKTEMSDILVTDLFDETAPRKLMKVDNSIEDKDEDLSEDHSDDDNSSESSKMDMLDNPLFKGMFTQEGSENVMGSFGKLAENVFGTMLNPVLTTSVKIIKPFLKNMVSTLETLKKDYSLPKDQRRFYKKAYNYYKELDEIYSRDINVLEQATLAEEVGRKYNKDDIERILKEDPRTSSLLDNIPKSTNNDLEESLKGFESLGDQCTIS